MNNLLEKDIVQRLKSGEVQAFDEIYNLYSKRIYRFAYSFLKTKVNAEEIVQEVFLRVWEKRAKINKYYSFKAFLFTVSHNIIIDNFRENLKEQKYVEFLKENAVVFHSDTEMSIEYSELNKMYWDAIDLLPERRRLIFKLHRIEGLSYSEISQKLNISNKTVENQMSSALKFLKEKLGSYFLSALLFYYLFF
jgi:RNA polymerase sigma-70 factor (ECF subfamily)